MADLLAAEITRLLDAVDNAPTNDAKGAALEALGKYLFESAEGVECCGQNILEGARAQELDLAFWIDQRTSEFYFLDAFLIVECKATASRVSSREVGWFVRKLQDHGAHVAVLIALNGITGDGGTAAQSEVLGALTRDKIKILLLTRAEIIACRTTSDLATLLKEKILKLTRDQVVQFIEEQQ